MLALCALPTLVFFLLVTAGDLNWLPGLLSWATCTAVALGFGALLGRDIAILARLVSGLRADSEKTPHEAVLLVPGMRSLGQQAINLIRTEQLSRSRLRAAAAADHALLERLPDPLLRLDEAGAVNWRNASAASAFGTETAALLRHPELRASMPPSSRSAARPMFWSPTARASAASRKCVPISSPIPATNCAPRWPA
jgi:two-component system phosphate regulon sensor histidine kinase PhoR